PEILFLVPGLAPVATRRMQWRWQGIMAAIFATAYWSCASPSELCRDFLRAVGLRRHMLAQRVELLNVRYLALADPALCTASPRFWPKRTSARPVPITGLRSYDACRELRGRQ